MKPWTGVLLIFSMLFASMLAGCSALASEPSAVPTLATATAPAVSTSRATPTTTQASPAASTLLLWLPPQFDPANGSSAGVLLQAHLKEFTSRRPGLRVEVRLKAVDGPGGLLNSLTTTSAAAPGALPDLIALPYELYAPAAVKGLLQPFDDLDTLPVAPDYFPYADELAHLQSSILGIPLAGDALVLVYRPVADEAPPTTWEEVLAGERQLAFAAADPTALFTLALYRATGGQVVDEQGRPVLQESILARVFAFYSQAETNGRLSPSLVQYASTSQVWQAFTAGQADMVVVWASQYLRDKPADAVMAPLPTQDGKPYTLATGYVWAVAATTAGRREMAVQFAHSMAEEDFVVYWTQASGYLPPQPRQLDAWSSAASPALETVALSAHLAPQPEISAALGLALQKATAQLLSGQSEAEEAARLAAQSLISP